KASDHSVVDRTGTTYEIGDASSTKAYKNWLQNSIGSGSGYYYDSTDSSGLINAYNDIFAKIKHQTEVGSKADWVASDPMPSIANSDVEFIAFYNKKQPPTLDGSLTGEHVVNGENTASFSTKDNAISWDLKNSGYTSVTSGGTTTYTYQLVYRVRLKNENPAFAEGTIYPTNDRTTLSYRTVERTDGNLTVSEPKEVEFPIPSVHGYLSALSFTKVDQLGNPLAGVTFTLSHDTDNCGVCRGDGSPVAVQDMTAMTATSAGDGTVSFSRIPSGHKYTLQETKVPVGVLLNSKVYHVTVAYDQITGDSQIINGEVANDLTTLTISKQVIGSDEQKDDPFSFTLTLTPPTETVLQSAYDAQYFVWSAESQDWVKDRDIFRISVSGGKATFTLKHNQQLTIYGLPEDTNWVIAEDAPGYKVTYTADGKSGNGSTATGTLKDNAAIAYTNQSMARLPETGGPGRTLYTWAGIMLCMLSVLLYKLLKRRRGDEHLT
ncbi:MAG: SpaA isopeptide-forming pilin-related protein, partial [Eubacteriales bacterium]|nr:SpaA isopeptide-forming pilin-related protein [Eubacteriales bacterium]